MPFNFTVVAGPHTGREFPLDPRATYLVGQAPDCHFRLTEDPYASDRQLLFVVSGPRCRVIDLNSRRGTKVNGGRVESADLADGDEVRAGQTVFKLSVSGKLADRPKVAATGEASPHLPQALPLIPGYEFEKELGRGGLGVVYRATRLADGEQVAVKMILPATGEGGSDGERFLCEVRTLTGLRHPNLAELVDCGAVGPLVYVVTENVNGANAEQIIRSRGPVSVRAAVLMTAHALTGLARLHARGKVHRDVKPTNLLVGTIGDKKAVKVTDYGVAQAARDANLGGPDAGVPAFAAPEQITHPGTGGPAADQYSTAATLYFLLTGSPPHDLPDHPDRALATILTRDPVPIRDRRPDLPEELADAVHKALHRDPAARFSRADQFRQALTPYLTTAAAPAPQSVC